MSAHASEPVLCAYVRSEIAYSATLNPELAAHVPVALAVVERWKEVLIKLRPAARWALGERPHPTRHRLVHFQLSILPAPAYQLVAARGNELDRIIGLESGADDYIVKPFSLEEFMARVRVVLRRTSVTRLIEQVESGDLTLDLRGRRVRLNGQQIKLSHKEFELLSLLMQNKGPC